MSAASARGLLIEPGSTMRVTARFSPETATTPLSARVTVAIARISPVRGRETITVPDAAPASTTWDSSRFSTSNCTVRSMVSTSESPVTGATSS